MTQDIYCKYYTLDENSHLRQQCLDVVCPKEYGMDCKLKWLTNMKKHEIITVLGSTRFRKEIEAWAWKMTKGGFMVLFAPFSKEDIPEVEDYRATLESIHFQKIRMADKVYVFNLDQYIGESTKLEIKYAEKLEKEIFYHETGCVDNDDDVNIRFNYFGNIHEITLSKLGKKVDLFQLVKSQAFFTSERYFECHDIVGVKLNLDQPVPTLLYGQQINISHGAGYGG